MLTGHMTPRRVWLGTYRSAGHDYDMSEYGLHYEAGSRRDGVTPATGRSRVLAAEMPQIRRLRPMNPGNACGSAVTVSRLRERVSVPTHPSR